MPKMKVKVALLIDNNCECELCELQSECHCSYGPSPLIFIFHANLMEHLPHTSKFLMFVCIFLCIFLQKSNIPLCFVKI